MVFLETDFFAFMGRPFSMDESFFFPPLWGVYALISLFPSSFH